DDNLPPRRDVVGSVPSIKGPVRIMLERVPRDDGTLVWKISNETVAKIPELYDEFGYGRWEQILPSALLDTRVFQVPLWQWLAIVLLVLVTSVIAWLATSLVVSVGRTLVKRSRTKFDDKLLAGAVGPVRMTIGVLVFSAGAQLFISSLRARELVTNAAQ